MNLTLAEKKTLLSLARRTIERWVRPEGSSLTDTRGNEMNESLYQNCGAFVSVYVEGKLRGCIGTFSEEGTLYENVKNMSISAATADNRFSPITADELDRLKIEISVLSPRKRIKDEKEIIPGIHGIYMIRGPNRGTLLPQVAIDQNWTVDEFLGNCAKYKAGIGWDGWKTAELYSYRATVFNSEEIKLDC
jgi:AmmeMemoRadiSam system protein A